MDRSMVFDAISGPVASIRTPFSRDGSLDMKGLASAVEFYIDAGSKTMLLTTGDSLFTLLGDQEIAEVTRAVVRQSRGRALVVGATPFHWGTPQAVQFARCAREMGVDLLQPFAPNWYPGAYTDDDIFEYYATLAVEIPIMANSRVMFPSGADLRGDLAGLSTSKTKSVLRPRG